MKHLFIPYELAVIAKEKGFDQSCIGFYDHNKEVTIFEQASDTRITAYKTSEVREERILAPIYQQIVNWFREEPRMIKIYESESFLGLQYQWYVKKAGSKSIGPFEINKAIKEAFKLK